MLTLAPEKMNLKSNIIFLTERYNLKETISTYQQMLSTVTNYSSAIINLPDIKLNNPADWYTAQFIQDYSKARVHPRCWTNKGGILDQLNQIPANIVQYDLMFQGMKLQISSLTSLIINDPTSKLAEEAKKQLSQYLSTLQQTVKGYQCQVSGVCKEITDFKDAINKYKDFFIKLYNDSQDTKKADDTLIADFNKQIDNLNKDIKKWNDVKIAMLASVGVTALATVISLGFGPIGIIIGIFCGIGMIAEGITELVADEKVKEDTKKLKEVTEKFDSYTEDANFLNTLIQQLSSLTSMLDDTVKAIEGIDKEWKQLDTNIDTLLQHIEKAKKDEEEQLYKDILDMMDKSNEEWTAIVDAAKKLQGIDEKIDADHVYPVKIA